MIRQLTFAAIVFVLNMGCEDKSGDKYVELGSKYYLKEDYENAERTLKKAINKELVKHTKQEVYTILGNLYLDWDKYDSAILYHKKALQIDSTYGSALVNLGIVYRKLSEYDSAQACYEKAKKYDPENPELYTSLGALYIFRGEAELGIKNLEHAIRLDPDLEVAHANYALALAMVGDFEKADKELRQAITLGYKNGDIIKERINELRDVEPD
jgi:tetratricopeptide (TPR) repeat protein